MWKPIAAGLMSLGFVTLSVAASQGDDDEVKLPVERIAVGEEGKPVATPAKKPEPTGNVVEIRIGEDGNATVVGKGEKKENEEGEAVQVIIQNEDGKILRKTVRNLPSSPAKARFRVEASAIDPETRQALETMIAGLKHEAKRLQGEQKKEEAEKKLQSVRVLEQLLNPGPRWGTGMRMQLGEANFDVRTLENDPANAEMQKLHDSLQKLHAQASKLGEGDHEAREKLQRMRAALEKTMVERQRQRFIAARGAGPGAPGTPVAPGTPFAPGQPIPMTPGTGIAPPMAWIAGAHAPVADDLTRKAQALSQASARLKEAGLEQQARELHEQAEKLMAEAEKVRSQAPAHPGFGPWGAGGPPQQLQQSIHELQEQVQQLRKEIGELRELLQSRK